MVKGSLGSRMAPIVKALQRAYPHHDERDTTAEAHPLERASAQG
jgi:hypothetical protein